MSYPIISVENLSKKYTVNHQQEGYTTFRDAMTNGARSLGQALFNRKDYKPRGSGNEDFWALKDVNFEIQQGDRVGIIGRNGAGKSTLLKVLSRITEPTNGSIRIKGRVASLLEVGTGFHPELTGRENIFLNGAILGMEKSEIKRKFDEIIEFAEIERFLDTPVKRYSSGMYVRLAFAVAAHLEPEILIVDEVLAVGDTQFQKKCLGKMGEVAKGGRTVLFVSHNMAAISALCSTAIVLHQGQVIRSGNTDSCIAAYEVRNNRGQGDTWVRPLAQKSGSLIITQITSVLKGEQPCLQLELSILLESRARHKPAFLAIDILNSAGFGVMQALPQLTGFLEDTEPEHSITVSIDLPPIIPGQYLLTTWVGSHNTETLDEVKEVIMFEVYESPTQGRSFPHTADHGYIVPHSKVILSNVNSFQSHS